MKQRKETLYNNKNIEKWELSKEDRNIDFNNKDLVMSKILPKDTAVVKEIKKYLIYYATQLDNEYLRLKDIIEKNNNNMLKTVKEKCIQNINILNKFWTLMDYKIN